ncbi:MULTISPECIES: protein phosphatase 2C domain-containing protein [unclassified Nonomuraea]|uniref:protein phosphatase 2C domain-containing protein n=1 Tax=unclassified Nonomuraea TaxID=2593643 RepID=UPI0033F240FA
MVPVREAAPPGRPRSDAAAPRYAGNKPSPVAVLLPIPPLLGHPSVQAESGGVGGVTVRAASCRGREHMAEGESRQDAFVVGCSADGKWLIAAVADGVGTTFHAECAAQTAVSTVVMEAARLLKGNHIGPREDDWGTIFGAVAYAIEERRAELSAYAGDRRPCSTTLVALVAPVYPASGDHVYCAGVGDSLAFRLGGRTRGWEALLVPDASASDGISDNVTWALPSNPDRLRTAVVGWERDDVLCLGTDGFTHALGRGSPLREELAAEWRTPPDIMTFIRDVDYRRATFNDDRTVVALWPSFHDGRVP